MDNKIFGELNDFEIEQEKEFRKTVESIAYYQGDTERVTIDGEWTEEELIDNIKDEAFLLIEKLKDNFKNKACYNNNLKLPEFLSNELIDRIDVIEEYNKLVDKHRNDSEKCFGIHYFDRFIISEMENILKNNLVSN